MEAMFKSIPLNNILPHSAWYFTESKFVRYFSKALLQLKLFREVHEKIIIDELFVITVHVGCTEYFSRKCMY